MFRIDTASNTGSLPTPVAAGTQGYFQEGANPTPGTQVHADWLNALQEEVIGVMTLAGVTPVKLSGSLLITTHLQQSLKRLLGTGVSGISASTTLTLDQTGLVEIDATAGSITLTLPAAAAMPWRYEVRRVDGTVNSVTIVRAGSDSMMPGTQTSAPLLPGETLLLRSDGSSVVWVLRLRPSPWSELAGSGSLTMPAGYTGVEADVIGGGGGGAAGDTTYAGGGGGAGGTARGSAFAVYPGTVCTYAVGAGGAGGTAGGNGVSGSASSFSAGYLSLVANGGGAGNHSASPAGGAGGTASGGDDNQTGGAGGDGSQNYSIAGGNGGASSAGGGGRGANGSGTILNGVASGSGGGGGYNTATTGGTGAAGRIKVRWLA